MKYFVTTMVLLTTMTISVQAAPVDTVPGTVNLALGQSVTTNDLLWSAGWSPNLLTDGGFVTAIHGNGPGGQAPAATPILGFGYTIDLGSTQTFDSIDLLPRVGCCPDRLKDVHLSVLSDDAGSPGVEIWSADVFQGVNADPADVRQTFIEGDGTGTFNGRFISIISNQNPVEQYELQLSEVEVLITGLIPVNHALGALVTSSGPVHSVNQSADKITDGIRGGTSISHPAASENVGVGNPSNGFSYTIELPTPVEIDNINVVGRGDTCCPDRLLDYRIEVFDVDPAIGTPTPLFTQDATGLDAINARVDNYAAIDKTGQWVKITNLSDVDFSPQIAEVEVFGHAITTPTSIPGDINDDKTVDSADVAEFVKFFGLTGFGDVTTGDFNDDQQTDLADLLIIKKHFGETLLPAPNATAVPEPTSILLLLVSMLSLGIYGYRRM